MSKKKPGKQSQLPKPHVTSLAYGVKLLHRLEGHGANVYALAFDPQGETLASGGDDGNVKLWDVRSGAFLRTFGSGGPTIRAAAFDPLGRSLASVGDDRTLRVWDLRTHQLVTVLEFAERLHSLAFHPTGSWLVAGGDGGHLLSIRMTPSPKVLAELNEQAAEIYGLGFDPSGETLAAGLNRTIALYDFPAGRRLRMLEGHESGVGGVAFDPRGQTLASASTDGTVRLWDFRTGSHIRTLEGHTDFVETATFTKDGRLLASKSWDGTVRVWDCETWETVAIIQAPRRDGQVGWIPSLAFHPTRPVLACACSTKTGDVASSWIEVWELHLAQLKAYRGKRRASDRAVHHTTAKVVLLGDHSVGKSALGVRMVHGRFEKQESTHGQQFWVFPELGKRRADGTDCEAILWDFAGQPDYRLVHALFVDNTDLALVLFDASDLREPLHGVDFWLKQLQTQGGRCPIVLVAAQTDRGSCPLTDEELATFCRTRGLEGPVKTSALSGQGVTELVARMKALVPWDAKPATVTTATFKRVKDYVLGLKEKKVDGRAIVTPEQLRGRLQALDAKWQFTDAEMLTAVSHLENYGYVKRLRTSAGEHRILLQPEVLNNLASSFVLEARRNPKGLGALEEKRLLAGGYGFPELRDLSDDDRAVLLDSAAVLFLEHNVCFRETDPLRVEPYLVFPELINLKKPVEEDVATEDGVAYLVSGPTENVFASLVVLLGYTHTFTRTAQWQNNARYELGAGLACGFRQEAERDGELEFVLCFGPTLGAPVRTLFQGLFESFLARRNLTVRRYEPVRCGNGHQLNRTVVREAMHQGDEFSFCSKCGAKVALPPMSEPIQLTSGLQAEVEVQRRAAEQRTRFEQAVFRVRAYVAEERITPPETFVSYAWGVSKHERWVEKRLATDLQKAGIEVLLDRWHNSQIGASVPRFIERIEKSDRIVIIGTPLYRRKYENKDTSTGYVVAAEVDLVSNRLVGTEDKKRTVLPVLLEGEGTTSLPPLLHGRVYADFRNESAYFRTAFDLILSLYEIRSNDPVVAHLRESLRET